MFNGYWHLNGNALCSECLQSLFSKGDDMATFGGCPELAGNIL